MTRDELVAECLARIDLVGLRRVNEVYPNSTWSKFFNAGEFLNAAAEHALRFDEEMHPGSRAIDVGCGFGYVALALNALGHSCVAWDNNVQILKNVANMIPIRERIFKEITRAGLQEGAELAGNYDLIFLHGVIPMRDAGGWWQWADYAALAKSFLPALNPGGRMEWIVNRGDQLPVVSNTTAWLGLLGQGFNLCVADNVVTVRRMAEVTV
jgi:cyclopropane fatty-acyl-phospholipid synthase-like methyltransferase